MATAALVISFVGAVGGFVQARKMAKAQKKQNKITNKVAAIARQRSIKQSIAARRIAVAQQQSIGFNLGVSGGTAVAGGVAGITSDTASAIGASNLQFTGQQFVSGLQDDISGFQQNANAFGAVSRFAGGVASNPQAVAALDSLVS